MVFASCRLGATGEYTRNVEKNKYIKQKP